MPWYNVTFDDESKLRVEAATKVEAASRATAHAIRLKREWLVMSVNVTRREHVETLAIMREPELEFAGAE